VLHSRQGIERLVHVSALGASVDSQSNFLRSKALGETGLLEGFPSATIMRPASVFGDEDRLFNRIVLLSRHLPLYPLINGGNGLSQPVFCADVAEAIVKAATDPETAGKIYSLCGPKVSSFKDLVNYAFKVINEQPNAVAVPKSVGMAMGYAFEQLPGPWMTRDQLRMQAMDITMPEGGLGLQDLGITPTAYDPIAERYLLMYRKNDILVDEGEKIIQAPR